MTQQTNAPSSRVTDHHFVFYGDACSGVPGATHERTFAATNAVVSGLRPAPDFIVFGGDEIRGLTSDEAALRDQWRYWLDVEMAWLDRREIPLYHATSNHTTYDAMSERVFADVLHDLPRNGAAGQEGLSYFIRRDDLLVVFVHTSPSHLGGEGRVETEWLQQTLHDNEDARYKLVVGHHPVFPVNGFSGEYQRQIGAPFAKSFWGTLVDHGVLAYLCSHILAFDVQVHTGVLQIVSAGAGTAHRMPEEEEYLHCVDVVLGSHGLHYRVLDQTGTVRERLFWPLTEPLETNDDLSMTRGVHSAAGLGRAPMYFDISGTTATDITSQQTFLSVFADDSELAPFWLGLIGADQRVTATMVAAPGRSPHYWLGPSLSPGSPFHLQMVLHPDMGAGGLLWRFAGETRWSSLESACAWGTEKLDWPTTWSVGHGKGGTEHLPFAGSNLRVASCHVSEPQTG